VQFQRLPQFDKDWAGLPDEHKDLFRRFVDEKFRDACVGYEQSPASFRWPKALCVKRMVRKVQNPKVFEVAPSFKQPAIRATFHFQNEKTGLVLYWRRIGDHSIYTTP
jgi:hypothetical protein